MQPATPLVESTAWRHQRQLASSRTEGGRLGGALNAVLAEIQRAFAEIERAFAERVGGAAR
jgi:hypothetical protein